MVYERKKGRGPYRAGRDRFYGNCVDLKRLGDVNLHRPQLVG